MTLKGVTRTLVCVLAYRMTLVDPTEKKMPKFYHSFFFLGKECWILFVL